MAWTKRAKYVPGWWADFNPFCGRAHRFQLRAWLCTAWHRALLMVGL